MEKRCSKCKLMKPLEAYYEQAAGKYGRTARCIECVSEDHRLYKERMTPPSIKDARARKQFLFASGLKECKKCGEVKPFDEFFKSAKGRPVSPCKTCNMNAHREWKSKNPQHMFEYVQEYASRPEVKKKKSARRARLYAESPRMVMQTTLAHGLKRRPTQNPATIEDLMQKWRDHDGCCALSGIKMTWNQGTVLPTSVSLDRIDPDGGYSADNIRLICHAFNAFRGRMADEQMLSMVRAYIAKVDADDMEPTWAESDWLTRRKIDWSTEPTWKSHLVQSETM